MAARPLGIVTVLVVTLASACGVDGVPDEGHDDLRNVVQIVARGLSFDVPASLPSGWTTIRFVNESEMVHFALIERMPDGVGLVEQQQQVAPVFQEGMNFLNSGDTDKAMAAFGKLPAWFHDIEFVGGPGLVSGGRAAETTVYLEPGTYLVECYVKTGGVFHSYSPSPGFFGMVAQIEVVESDRVTVPPESSVRITLSSADGIVVDGSLRRGPQVVEVVFDDQQPYENFVGHDLHVVALDESTSIDAVDAWMDWRSADGLQTPAPARFLGGTNEMPAGSRTYLHLDLAPGNYAWIAEVPEPAGKDFFKRFSVSP